MSILKVTTIQNGAGTEVYTTKAWVNFNGTGVVAIRASGNVTSITDNGTGDYTVNITTAPTDANYSVHGNSGRADVGYTVLGTSIAPTTTQYRLTTWTGFSPQADSLLVFVSIIR